MAVFQPKEIETEEQRHDSIEESFVSDVPSFPGIKCVRDITPLVMTALQRANNPYITARRGFDAIGIEFSGDGKQVTDSLGFAIAMMPKTAEVLVLLSCPREELKRFARLPGELESVALDLVDSSTMEAMAAATVFISERLQAITKARATNSPEDEKPSAGPLGDTGPKEPAPTG